MRQMQSDEQHLQNRILKILKKTNRMEIGNSIRNGKCVTRRNVQ